MASFSIRVFEGRTPFARRWTIVLGRARSCVDIQCSNLGQTCFERGRTSTLTPSRSFSFAGVPSSPVADTAETLLLRGGIVSEDGGNEGGQRLHREGCPSNRGYVELEGFIDGFPIPSFTRVVLQASWRELATSVTTGPSFLPRHLYLHSFHGVSV